jgi:putative ABC transport system permease protein
MLRNHLIVAVRNLYRNKYFALINIVGLAVALTGCIFLLLFIQHELSFDSFHTNADSIYRVVEHMHNVDGFTRRRAYSGTPLLPLIRAELPSVQQGTRVSPWEGLVRYKSQCFREGRFFFADAEMFDIFSFPLLSGDSATVLRKPNTVVITPEAAGKYFGDESPLGKTITFENSMELTVTGVLREIPSNSHLQFDFLASFSTLEQKVRGWTEHWDSQVATYLQVREGMSFESVETQLKSIAEKHRNREGTNVTYSLEPIRNIHMTWTSSVERLYVLGAIAVIMLAIAVINYSNLSMARLVRQARTIGLRRVLGADRSRILAMIIGESVMLAVAAMCLAITLVEILQPGLASLTGIKSMAINTGNWLTFLAVTMMAPVVGILGGLYPALHFSSGSDVAGMARAGMARYPRSRVWSILVVLQFCAATVLVCAGLVVSRQHSLLIEKDLGFDPDNIVAVRMDYPEVQSKYSTLKEGLKRCPGVLSVAAASKTLAESDCNGLSYRITGENELRSVPTLWVDQDYLRTLGIGIVQGADFGEGSEAGKDNCFLVNESARTYLGLDTADIQQIEAYSGPLSEGTPWYQGNVVGVAQDFHFRYLRCSLQPLVMILDPKKCEYLLVRVDSDNMASTLAAMEKEWLRMAPFHPFEASYLKDDLSRLYRSEANQAFLIRGACYLAVVVACLGLIGLVASSAERRTKEIGVRKVLGSSVVGILSLVTREFVFLVAIANLVACPIAYYALSKWLENFVYKIVLDWELFMLTFLLTVGIAMLAVSTQAIRAARANPVDALKYE